MPNFKPDFVVRTLDSRGASPSRTPTQLQSEEDQEKNNEIHRENAKREKLQFKLNEVKRLTNLSKAAYSRTQAHYTLPENTKFEATLRKAKPIENSNKPKTKSTKSEDLNDDIMCSRYLKYIQPIESNPFRTGLNTMINTAYNGVFQK